MPDPIARSVFNHTADSEKISALRAAVISDVSFLLANYENFRQVKAAGLSAAEATKMVESYSRLLHYGHFSLPKTRPVANELIWKWTEATGKYIGCQFWSLKAKEFFDLEVEKKHGGWPIPEKEAKELAIHVSKKSGQTDARLTHEHVYPIRDMKIWLSDRGKLSQEQIRIHFERQCVACVVLESEHIRRTHGFHENPWLRYKSAGITLSPNPDWLAGQRALVDQADLLRRF